MATEREQKLTSEDTPDEPSPAQHAPEAVPAGAPGEPAPAGDGTTPTQLGYRRFVYGAYFAGAIAIAFLSSKFAGLVWERLAAKWPLFGEPSDDIIMPIAAVFGACVAYYYWRRPDARKYAEEVASELSQVTWPTRREVTSSTTIVIITTIFATVFFALMDRFWGFLTNIVYGA